MAKYFLDFEFNEHFVKTGSFWNRREVHTIEPISMGMVCEDGRELELFFNDYDITGAWNKYDLKSHEGGIEVKIYWLRENVLKPIIAKLFKKLPTFEKSFFPVSEDLEGLKKLLKRFGVSKSEAGKQLREFCQGLEPDGFICFDTRSNPEFYAYFADYDWVAFCQCFGTMMQLPNTFPMYCNDLKQMLDTKVRLLLWLYGRDIWSNSFNDSIHTVGRGAFQSSDRHATFDEKLKKIKSLKEYPVQTDEHDAINDARWNLQLFNFLNIL